VWVRIVLETVDLSNSSLNVCRCCAALTATNNRRLTVVLPDPITQAAGLKPTFSAQEAAALLGRSYSWLDQRLREKQFVLPDGSVVQPVRTPGGYRRFTLEALKDIALCSYNHGWFSMNQLRSVFRELAMTVYGDCGEYQVSG
jgi:hypothetical protein